LNFRTCLQASLLFTLAAFTPSQFNQAHASEIASATMASTQVDPTTWLYSIQLDDVGTTDVGTFWFAWIPGEDFLATSPTNILAPAGWTDVVTHAGGGDGYAIQWVAGAGSAITPGNALGGFQFESSTSPAAISGNSPFFPGTPELTSFIYSGAPFSDVGFRFVVQEQAPAGTPEPASLPMTVLGAAILWWIVRPESAFRHR
jgi:hypothetical protein